LIKSRLLKKYSQISHGFFNSRGGYSKKIYSSLNCGFGSNDSKHNVKKNLEKVCLRIGCDIKELILLNQVHSNKVIFIKKKQKKKLNGDSLFTNKKKIAIGILTADCAPIFMFDPFKNYIAAIHAGWKGAFRQIIKKTTNKFVKKGSKKKDIIAVIGPCISQNSYEVKNDFLKKFLKQDKKNIYYFKFKKKNIFFSLNRYIKNQLMKSGVKKVEIIKKDTYTKKNNYFSSRRSKKEGNNDYGRNISIIMIK
tara:strand:+ start:318 stop:1070 length:753 start_codon:yes stop_codon:yes gene_type:complete